jgi:hypothetical protein
LGSHWQHWPGRAFQQGTDHTACSAQQAEHSRSTSRAITERSQLLRTRMLLSGVLRHAWLWQPATVCHSCNTAPQARPLACLYTACALAQQYCVAATVLCCCCSPPAC